MDGAGSVPEGKQRGARVAIRPNYSLGRGGAVFRLLHLIDLK